MGAIRRAAILGAMVLLGCESMRKVMDPRPPQGPTVLEGSDIELVSTRFAGAPPELYTRSNRLLLRVFFDPVLVDLERLSACTLWAQDRPGGPWRSMGSFRASGGPLTATFVPETDGAYGLQVSAVHADGTERLVPGPADLALVWIHVDRNPPSLTWIAPIEGAAVKVGQKVELRWGASEMRFGEVPLVVEWSGDGGEAWKGIDRVRAQSGTGGVKWRVPPEAAWSRSKPLVRITAWDLVGNRAASILPLEVEGLGAVSIPEVSSLERGPGDGSSPPESRPTATAVMVPGPDSPASLSTRPHEPPRPDPNPPSDLAVVVESFPEEGSRELALLGRDRVGNGSSSPTAGTTPLGKFVVDHTPPTLHAQPTDFPWVEGMLVAARVEMDLADLVPPLWLEERAPGGGWIEVLQWESFPPGEDLFRFPVPVGREEYEIRFGIRDRAGNVSYAAVGPRPVERSIRLDPLVSSEGDSVGPVLPAGRDLTLRWALHPALKELAGELRVVLSHQEREGGEWIQLREAPAASAFVWTLPDGDAETHRLRVSLFHRQDPLGEDWSGPFTIAGRPPPAPIEPQVVAIDENSLYYAERGELEIEKYRQATDRHRKWLAGSTAGLRRDSGGLLLPEEMEKLPADLRRQAAEQERLLNEAAEKIRASFQKALELDPRNYRAAYGMAQLLRCTAPQRSEEAIRYLEQAVAIKADHAPALNDLGVSCIQSGEHKRAEEALRRAVQVSNLGPYQYNLALALYHQEKTAEACRHFEEALQRGGSAVKPGDVYYYLVSASLKEGQIDEARRRLDLYGSQIPPPLFESLSRNLGTAP